MTERAEAGWDRLRTAFLTEDGNKIKDIKEDIDTLLVFAGLFSAVLTAFNIESYQQLQTDPEGATAFVLVQILRQLNSTARDDDIFSAFQPAPPSVMIVTVNALWFLSLSFGLITASVAILVKQWIREHMALDDNGWKFCLNRWGMTRYRVYEIAACLPVLLQVALILFFAGLVLFVHTFNPLIGWLVSAVVIPWFIGFCASIVASILDPSCPYRTP
ncbi:hypothetical protein K474DRAFT_1607045, partial [Panus rudis PR-1116 ss-1]